MIDARDAALQQSCPVIAAPMFGALPPMAHGQRIVLAKNGVFIQVKRAWLDSLQQVGVLDPRLPLPYGEIAPVTAFSFGVIPVTLLQAFIDAGRAALPNEIAGGLIYTQRTGMLRLALYEPIEHSPDGIAYRMPDLLRDEAVAVDLHTHGRHAAFFSTTDDEDDRCVKVAGVFGNLDQARPSAAFRLVINGLYKRLPHPWETRRDEGLENDGRWPTLESMGDTARQEWNM